MHTQSIDQKTESIPFTFYITSSKAVGSVCGDMRTVTFARGFNTLHLALPHPNPLPGEREQESDPPSP
jgi:hypothetical protein